MRTHQSEFSVEKMAAMFKVSRSGFYRPDQAKSYDLLDKEIISLFTQHKGRYGSPRIHAELKKQGVFCSQYVVEKRMRVLGLYSGKKKRRPKTTVPAKESSKDLLHRDFTATEPNENWCGDISYLPVKGGFVYLSVILDLYARKIVAWVILDHMEQELVLQTLDKILNNQHFGGKLLSHADRGSQYSAHAVQDFLSARGLVSSQGLCAYDNAVMEFFLAV